MDSKIYTKQEILDLFLKLKVENRWTNQHISDQLNITTREARELKYRASRQDIHDLVKFLKTLGYPIDKYKCDNRDNSPIFPLDDKDIDGLWDDLYSLLKNRERKITHEN